MEIQIRYYVTTDGREPFSEWLDSLRDIRARARIRIRLDRARFGNFGDHEPVGESVCELRIHYGPGYRVYYGIEQKKLVLLLAGGTKKTQAKDIKKAKVCWQDYKKRR